jgi:hypothetical protein
MRRAAVNLGRHARSGVRLQLQPARGVCCGGRLLRCRCCLLGGQGLRV